MTVAAGQRAQVKVPGERTRKVMLDAGDLCRPSGPDGEGQARGQARNARGEPLRSVGAAGSAKVRKSGMIQDVDQDVISFLGGAAHREKLGIEHFAVPAAVAKVVAEPQRGIPAIARDRALWRSDECRIAGPRC
jgi:hypothetical protein